MSAPSVDVVSIPYAHKGLTYWRSVEALIIDDRWVVVEHPPFVGVVESTITHRPTGLAVGFFKGTREEVRAAAGKPPSVGLANIVVGKDGIHGRPSKADAARLMRWVARIEAALAPEAQR